MPFSKKYPLFIRVLLIFTIFVSVIRTLNKQDLQIQAAELNYVPGEVIVKFKVDPLFPDLKIRYKINTLAKVFQGAETPDKELLKFKTKFAQEITQGKKRINEVEFLKIDLSKTYLLTLEQNQDPLTVSRSLASDPNVIYAEPNYYGYPTYDPDDPAFISGQQWALAKIQASQAWDIATGVDTITAVLDTGFDLNHSELQGKLLPGYSFTSDNNDVSDHPTQPCGHGTHVAGIVSAVTNNNLGIAGLAFNAKILPVKVLDRYSLGSGCFGSYSDFAAGVRYAADQGADVANMSFGGTAFSSNLQDAVLYGASRGLVLVGASGNNNSSTLFYPAAFDHVIAVAGTDSNDNRYTRSNYGNWIDVSAPAASIYSLYTGNTYITMTGTSMAAPHVSALSALIISRRADLKSQPQLVENIIENSVDDLGTSGFDEYFGYGRINAYQALTQLNTNPLNTPTPTPVHCLPLGDIDCSGQVDVLDLSTLISGFGARAEDAELNLKADLDNSEAISILDLSILLSNFGQVLP